MPRGQTTWSTALTGLDGPSDITTRLSLLSCTAGPVVTQAHTFTHSIIFHSLDSQCEDTICLVTGPNTIQDCRQDPPALMGWGRQVPLQCELNLLGRPCGTGWVNKDFFEKSLDSLLLS